MQLYASWRSQQDSKLLEQIKRWETVEANHIIGQATGQQLPTSAIYKLINTGNVSGDFSLQAFVQADRVQQAFTALFTAPELSLELLNQLTDCVNPLAEANQPQFDGMRMVSPQSALIEVLDEQELEPMLQRLERTKLPLIEQLIIANALCWKSYQILIVVPINGAKLWQAVLNSKQRYLTTFDINARLKIGELAKLSGEPVHTIRYWTQQGLIPVVDQSPGGYQLYSPQALETVRLIRDLESQGRYTLAEIKAQLQFLI